MLTRLLQVVGLLGSSSSSERWEVGFNPSLAPLEAEIEDTCFCSTTEGRRNQDIGLFKMHI